MLKNKNILIAIDSFWDGGAEMFAIRLANALSEKNNVYFLELRPYATVRKRQLSLLKDKNVILIQAGRNIFWDFLFKNKYKKNKISQILRNKLNEFHSKQKLKVIINLIKKEKIDIINSHCWDTDVYFSSLKNNFDFKLVSTFHGHYEWLRDTELNFSHITKSTLKNINAVIYTTENHFNTLNQYNYPLEKTHKIYYGISAPTTQQVTKFSNKDILKIVLVARGIQEKGWQEAIESVLLILSKKPNSLILKLVGESEYIRNLKSKYESDNIIFLGYHDDTKEIIDNCHIGILPTYYPGESLPNTVIEYLMSGKPVIASNIGSIREMITSDDSLAGYCLELYNGKVSSVELADSINKYLINPSLVESHSQIALDCSQKFTMDRCIENYEKCFKSVL